MAPSSRHLYPEWLRSRSARGGPHAGGPRDRQDDGAWRVWQWVRALDRRYAALVDLALAAALFVLCSGWVVEQTGHPSLWFVAALIFPLVLRRRAPMTVFLVIAGVAFVQWLVAGPALADVALLVALYTVALESEWPLVTAAAVILEAGVVMAVVRWNPAANDVRSFVFLTGLAVTALLAGVVVRALRSQLDWLAERAERLERERDQQASLAAVTERARIRAGDARCGLAQHSGDGHAGRRRLAGAGLGSGPGRRSHPRGLEHGATGLDRHAQNAGRPARRIGPGRRGRSERGAPTPFEPQPGLGELPALVERVRATGLDVSVRRVGAPFEVSDAAGLTVYRVVQEALTNALKHADEPTAVEVSLAFADPDVAVRVTDNGRAKVTVPPTSPASPRSEGGHGLAGMAERATAFGGTLRAGPGPARGWEVEAVLHDCKVPHPA